MSDPGTSAPAAPDVVRPTRPTRVRDRDVLAVTAAVVVLVLLANVVTGVIRPLDDLLGLGPVVVIALVVVTALITVRSLRSARRPELTEPRDPGPADPE
jgi:hypothetical protein